MGAPRRSDDLTGLIHTDSMFVVINTVVFPVGRRRETGHEHIAAGEQARCPETGSSDAKAVVAGRLDHGRAMRSTAMTRKASSTDPCGSLPKGVSA